MELSKKLLEVNINKNRTHIKFLSLYQDHRNDVEEAINICIEYVKENELLVSGMTAVDLATDHLETYEHITVTATKRKSHIKNMMELLESKFKHQSLEYGSKKEYYEDILEISLYNVVIIEIIKLEESCIEKIAAVKEINGFKIVTIPYMLAFMHNSLMDLSSIFKKSVMSQNVDHMNEIIELLDKLESLESEKLLIDTKPIPKDEIFCKKIRQSLEITSDPILYGTSAFLEYQNEYRELTAYFKDNKWEIDILEPMLFKFEKTRNLECTEEVIIKQYEIDDITINVHKNTLDVHFIENQSDLYFSIAHLQEIFIYEINKYFITKEFALFEEYLGLIRQYLHGHNKLKKLLGFNVDVSSIEEDVE